MLVIRPSLVRCLLRSLIFSWVIFLLWVLSILCIFWVTILCQTRLVKIFSPSLWLVFSFSWQGLSYSRRLYFNEVQLINYFSHELCLWFAPKKSLPHLRSSSVQFSRSVVSDSLTPRTAARQTSLSIRPASLSIANSRSLPKLKFIESVMPSNHLILCRLLLLLPSIFSSIRVFSNESVLCIRLPKYWSFSFSISPSNEYSGLISFRMDWVDLLVVQGTLKSLLQHQS